MFDFYFKLESSVQGGDEVAYCGHLMLYMTLLAKQSPQNVLDRLQQREHQTLRRQSSRICCPQCFLGILG